MNEETPRGVASVTTGFLPAIANRHPEYDTFSIYSGPGSED